MSPDLINILIEDNFAESFPLLSELTNALLSKKNISAKKSNSLSKKYLRRILEKYCDSQKVNKLFKNYRNIYSKN